MPRFDPERLTTLALLALEDAAAQGGDGIVRRTWGMRLALSWLHASNRASREQCDEFWALLIDPRVGQPNEAQANVCRSQWLTRVLNGIYDSAGVVRTPEMMFAGSTGRRNPQRHRAPGMSPPAERDMPPDL